MRISEKLNNKGITLISLVITIIVLLILAAVTLSLTLGERGIFNKVQEAKISQIKAQYYEEINLEILEEQEQRIITIKEELFIMSIKNRIEKNSWVDNIKLAIEDEEGNIKEILSSEIRNPNIIIITTKEKYRIMIKVDNAKCIADVKDTMEKVTKTYKIEFNGNGGTLLENRELQNQESDGIFGIYLPENPYKKQGYSFIGWSEKVDGTNALEANTYYIPNKNITLYAAWSKDTITISFDKNAEDATGTMNDIEAQKNGSKALPSNAYEREGWIFKGWMIDKKTEIVKYANKATISNVGTEDIKLIAKWERIRCTVTISAEGSGTVSGTDMTNGKGIYDYGTQITIEGEPSSAFLGWYQGNTLYSTKVSTTITVKTNLTLVAKFKVYASSITIKQGNTTLTPSTEITGYYTNISSENYTTQVTATINPTNVTNDNYTWSSSNSNIVSVDSNGILTFKGVNGTTKTATITCTSADGKASSSFIARVNGYRHYIFNYPTGVIGNGLYDFYTSATISSSLSDTYQAVLYTSNQEVFYGYCTAGSGGLEQYTSCYYKAGFTTSGGKQAIGLGFVSDINAGKVSKVSGTVGDYVYIPIPQNNIVETKFDITEISKNKNFYFMYWGDAKSVSRWYYVYLYKPI